MSHPPCFSQFSHSDIIIRMDANSKAPHCVVFFMLLLRKSRVSYVRFKESFHDFVIKHSIGVFYVTKY
jgi:hypothetical protein